MIKALCAKPNCRSLLFDTKNFKGFNKPSPVDITCRGCGTEYRVKSTKGRKVILTLKGGSKPLPVEVYG